MEFVETKKFKDKWEEYKGGDWRRLGKTFVTMDTVIPPMPTGKEILQAPNETKFMTTRNEIEDKIKNFGAKLEEEK